MKRDIENRSSTVLQYSIEFTVTGANPEGLVRLLRTVRCSVPSGCVISKCAASTKKSLSNHVLIDVGFADIISSIIEGGDSDDSESSSSDKEST